jgi:hypothetical protein
VRGRLDAGARRSRSGYLRRGPCTPRLGACARIQARNAQRDLAVVDLVPQDAVSQLSVWAERRWTEGGRNRASGLAVGVS